VCRFLMYLGQPIHLSSLITEPENSLIHQSFDSRDREEPLNGDGFGVAWYAGVARPEAALFRSITPAWSNQNLRHLARATESGCVLAHVRAASIGMAVAELNSHPFAHGPYSFMHNGELADFWHHRRALMDGLDERRYELVEGTTDSECLFAYALQALDDEGQGGAEGMARALESALGRCLAHLAANQVRAPSTVNAVLCNGREAVACRFSNLTGSEAPSLHLHTGKLYSCASGTPQLLEADEDMHSVIIASEPLTDDTSWRAIAENSIVLVDAERNVTVRPMRSPTS